MLGIKLLVTATALAWASACAAQSPTNSPPNNRFAGGANVAGPADVSADARFELDATAFPPGTDFSDVKKLQPSASTPPTAPKALEQLGGRFGLTAALNNPNAPAVACTAVVNNIFKNGFE
jgi:hypothetical protein